MAKINVAAVAQNAGKTVVNFAKKLGWRRGLEVGAGVAALGVLAAVLGKKDEDEPIEATYEEVKKEENSNEEGTVEATETEAAE